MFKNRFIHALVVMTAAITPALANDETGGRDPAFLSPADVFNIEVASDPQISPDGSAVAYVRRSNDIMTDRTRNRIWMVALNGRGHRPLLADDADYSSPRWSPDGQRLAYISRVNDTAQICVLHLDAMNTAIVTNVRRAPRDLAWSPDGRHIAFVMDTPVDTDPMVKGEVKKPQGAKWAEPFKVIEAAVYRRDGKGFIDPARSHIFVVPADGGTPRQLTKGDYDHDGPLAWTPDGDKIIFSANRHDGWEFETVEADLFSVALDGTMRQLTKRPGYEGAPTISPDGKSLAFLRAENNKRAYRIYRLHVMALDGTGERSLTDDLDRSLGSLKWANDSSGVYAMFDDRGAKHIAKIHLNGAYETLVRDAGGLSLGRPYLSAQYDVSPMGSIVYTKSRPDRPADLVALRNGKPQQLTQLNEDALGEKKLGTINEIVYTSSLDGQEIQGWYVTPPDFDPARKYPLLLEIHGGPHLAYGPTFALEVQRYAAEGYVVFYDNHRGSSGYGEEFGLLLQYKYPSKDDFADHMSGVDAMIAKGFIDPEQLYVAGGSAGGVATAYAVGLTDRFRAAVAAKPIINWTSKTLTADSYIYQIQHQFPGMPWEAVDHYWERSPISLVGNVSTPTMLMTGEQDYRTPISESEQFYQALKLRGVPTALVRVPGSSHGIASRPSRLISKVEHTLAWFARFKEDDGSEDAGQE